MVEKMSSETQITNILNDILKVEAIEEAFSCVLVHHPKKETDKVAAWHQELRTAMTGLTKEQQEAAVRQFLSIAAAMTNHRRLQLLLSLLENLVHSNFLPARLVCECILSCDKLQYQLEDFWVECFVLIKHILGGVDYKGVREIMKGCKEKAQTIPARLDASVQPQLKALENVIEFIFDRNACLLPGYFIVNEIQKAYPDGKNWPHWKLAKLLSDFVESFRHTAQMVSIVGHSKMLPVVEHTGYADYLINPWLLDPTTLKFSLKGNLPYDPDLLKPQTELLRYVLEQPYSRDMVCSMLGLQKQHKQRCVVLEEQLVELVILAMERSENETLPAEGMDGTVANHWVWLHLSSQLIYFILFQFACFPSIVMAIHDKLAGRELRKGRDHLMWVLLQFISGSIQRNPLSNFLPVLKLYDLLYPEKEPLPVPDYTQALCTHQMAITCIWIHLLKKAQTEPGTNIHRPIPHTLKVHHEFLQHLVMPNASLCMGSDYRIALLCNAYSTNQEYFSRPMAALVDTILGTQKNQQQQPLQNLQNNAALANGPTTPLSMSILDSLTVHSKMSLIHSIVTHVIKLAQSKSNMALAPALVETYSRLLVYTEIESLGIKGFISQLLPTVFKSHAWGTLYTLLEMFSYRMHHIQPHYRVQLLSHLHSLAAVPQTNQTQLHLCVESTALRLITGLGSAEVQPQLSRFLSEPKTLVSAESEELNRALVLTLARSMHVTGTGADSLSGTWCKELLNTIMQNTPHSWANHTLQCFPPVLSEFFQQNSVAKENKQQIKKAVEEEYRNWASMNNENDIIAHFSVPGTPPLFLCLLWKMILETDRISPIAYKILERIGARALSAHLRKFCDYLVFEFANSVGGQHVNKCVDTINDMIWKYNIVTIDRLVLCLALRTQEGNEAQVCFFIIQLLLLKAAEFRNRVQEFVKENSPEHWKQSNWHEKHLAFHRKFPEKFAPEGIMEQTSGGPSQYQNLPVYFGNVCLRFLPVFDIVVHRYLEIPPVIKSLEILLEHLGCLYKFHDRPVTYLYNTLHYYEKKLRDRPLLKRRLVSAVLGSLREIRAPGWALSEAYQMYMTRFNDDAVSWVPELDYYIRLVQRIVETMSGTAHFPATDWRFNEFPNPAAHALYVTCVELMALPVAPDAVANFLLDVVAKGYTVVPSDEIHLWINCVGLLLAALPECYWSALHKRLLETISSPGLVNWQYNNLTPFQMFNFNITHNSLLENKYSYMLALAHSVWHHAGVGQITTMPQFIKEKLQPVVSSEEQLIYACHLIGPTLARFNAERPHCVVELAVCLYEMLERVDHTQTTLNYMDSICDLLYHIKYMFVGDMTKNEVECIIRRLRPALQMRLRFIAHINIDEIHTS
ncbi:PREDICTED: mediator of RNA polymerase II transcription subunit 23 [Atta cephalotes]|uniref:Mediator of RNA polymerase II transcription subunit 23 n=1 Tax=Atta cephalotes TaxID=12957 RepID=A0A158NHZ3_ATTCE|nr:PREDICTED: mediator of RNA polymerase II transcription subunit 23 [Atta cephalotes]XP_018056559.1 PREDICTED: mediator of RNA polymerase II transcription subunit 23 [Atta colombica]XP_018056560.1 PREDICTED: mediator of RNA polymerase II transcription subunit 23 [Atta colombica]